MAQNFIKWNASILTSAKEVMFLPVLVCPSVRPSVFQQDYLKGYVLTFVGLVGHVEHDPGKTSLKCVSNRRNGGAVINTLNIWPLYH